MPLWLGIPFYLAIVCYLASAVLALSYGRGKGEERALDVAKRVAAVGNILLLSVFLARGVQYSRVPLTNLGDSLNLFLVLCTGIILTVQRRVEMRPLLVFYLPALAALALVSAAVAPRFLGEAPAERNIILLTVHVGMVFLAFSFFFVASVTSMAYAHKAQRLKRHNTQGFAQRLPSLEHMDQALYRLIGLGYPTFVATLVIGFFWAWLERGEHGAYWYVAPRILLAAAMVVFYAVSFHGRKIGFLRGPKLAYFVFFGFSALLLVYLVISLLPLDSYSWGDST